jgi:hypothetical protein
MKANIPDELMEAINEAIYLDLELHIIEKRMMEAEKKGNKGFAEHLNVLFFKVSSKRKVNKQYLKDNGVKIFDPVDFNDIENEKAIFVDYHYSQSINGGYKEGIQRYWKDALRLNLKKRMNGYFKGG